jgi:purine-binding chemotaxis protein CheW
MTTSKKETFVSQSYLTFRLGGEEFAAHVNHVLNIIEAPTITRVPKSPDYMEGVTNLRGTVLPVVDLKKKFSMAETETRKASVVVVLETHAEDQAQPIYVGAVVDEVVAVHELDQANIQEPPSLGQQYQSEFISGVVHIESQFIMILDVNKLFTNPEIARLKDHSDPEGHVSSSNHSIV